MPNPPDPVFYVRQPRTGAQVVAVSEFMHAQPHTVGDSQSVAEASKRMREHQIRHLPVLKGGALVGMLSDRDVGLVESVSGAASADVLVAEVMSPEVFVVAPNHDLADVVARMATKHVGSAVVMEGSHVVGIFTTTDALRLLGQLLKAPSGQGAHEAR